MQLFDSKSLQKINIDRTEKNRISKYVGVIYLFVILFINIYGKAYKNLIKCKPIK